MLYDYSFENILLENAMENRKNENQIDWRWSVSSTRSNSCRMFGVVSGVLVMLDTIRHRYPSILKWTSDAENYERSIFLARMLTRNVEVSDNDDV